MCQNCGSRLNLEVQKGYFLFARDPGVVAEFVINLLGTALPKSKSGLFDLLRNGTDASLNFIKEIKHEGHMITGLSVVGICGGRQHHHALSIGGKIQVREDAGVG